VPISDRARALAERREGLDVEYKQSTAGLEASDIVAFANSKHGGAILVGVKEARKSTGEQYGVVVGCEVGDKARLQILDKALSCQPPVPVEVFVEAEGSATPFFRIEIPSGSQKPYGTSGGTYKTREDGRLRALTPTDLLGILVERESLLFEERFRKATAQLVDEMKTTAGTVADLNKTIKEEVEGISSTLGWTDMKVDDTASDIANTKRIARETSERTEDIERRLISLLAHSKVPDPVKEAARSGLVKQFRQEFKKKPEVLKAIMEGKSVSLTGEKINLFTQEELVAMMLEAVNPPEGQAV